MKKRFACQKCGVEFHPKNYRYTKYCSRECSFADGGHIRRANVAAAREKDGKHGSVFFKHCAVCGSAFVGRRADSRLCSNTCKLVDGRKRSRATSESKKALVEVVCKGCSVTFVPSYGDKARTFCSPKCGKKYAARVTKGVRRAKTRGADGIDPVDPFVVFKRDGWKCKFCGVDTPRGLRGKHLPNSPELDHVIPLSKGGAHTYENTQLLCRGCNNFKSDKIL
jgi:5-methylcytosine-specific restriction endonuclease McrA